MRKISILFSLLALFFFSSMVQAELAAGLNVVVTSSDRQAQMMAMVLSVKTIKKHGKEVNMVLCGSAGDLALVTTKTATFLPPKKSPTMLLKMLIKSGASVQVCPLYLPSVGKTKDDLIKGITVAKPPVVAGKLLHQGYRNLTF